MGTVARLAHFKAGTGPYTQRKRVKVPPRAAKTPFRKAVDDAEFFTPYVGWDRAWALAARFHKVSVE